MSELVAGRARINVIRDLEFEELLGRDPVRPDTAIVSNSLYGKSVMVTGAGGSIGSELCRQIIRHKPKVLVLFEQSEFSLYSIERELRSISQIESLNVTIHAILGSVTHRRRCEAVLKAFGVQAVYHAAAYKHVPLVEHNVIEGIQNNVFGTWHTAEAAIAAAQGGVGGDRVQGRHGRGMGAEDFSYMLEKRPGAYLFLGAGEGAGLHHPEYDFNDAIAPLGASFFARIVERTQPAGGK